MLKEDLSSEQELSNTQLKVPEGLDHLAVIMDGNGKWAFNNFLKEEFVIWSGCSEENVVTGLAGMSDSDRLDFVNYLRSKKGFGNMPESLDYRALASRAPEVKEKFRIIGHDLSEKAVDQSVENLIASGLKTQSYWAMSEKNFHKRGKRQVLGIKSNIASVLKNKRFNNKMAKYGIDFDVCGNREYLKRYHPKLHAGLTKSMNMHTYDGSGQKIIAIIGGSQSQQEAVRHKQELDKFLGKKLSRRDIDTFLKQTDSPQSVMHLRKGSAVYPDAILRPGGERRTSGFIDNGNGVWIFRDEGFTGFSENTKEKYHSVFEEYAQKSGSKNNGG